MTMLPCAPRSARLFASDRYSVPATIDPVLSGVIACAGRSLVGRRSRYRQVSNC